MEWRLSFSKPRIHLPIPLERYLGGFDRQHLERRNVILLLVESFGADQLRAYAWRRARIEYYGDESRRGREHAPILVVE